MTDMNHDARISALEENGGSGSQNGMNRGGKGFTLTDSYNSSDRNNCTLEFSHYFFSVSDTIAFYSVLTSYSTIRPDSAVIFNEVLLNEGDGYVIFKFLFEYIYL